MKSEKKLFPAMKSFLTIISRKGVTLLTTLFLWVILTAGITKDTFASRETMNDDNFVVPENTTHYGGDTIMLHGAGEVLFPQITIKTANIGINDNGKLGEIYARESDNIRHVDSLYIDLKERLYDMVSYQYDLNLANYENRLQVKAKAYLFVPISILLWLVLLIVARRFEDKLLIIISKDLLIAAIIGSFIVLPILIEGLT